MKRTFFLPVQVGDLPEPQVITVGHIRKLRWTDAGLVVALVERRRGGGTNEHWTVDFQVELDPAAFR
jgi:hypothetical protein